MVNTVAATRRRIIERLAGSERPISGNSLSAELGMSRVAVWKHINVLREAGYPVESGRSGYRMGDRPDFLYPWEFPGREDRVVHYDRTDSTMNRALELAMRGNANGAIVVAETQTAGRGRGGRTWRSNKGGLFFTMVLKPGLPVREARAPAARALLALCVCLRELAGEPFRPVWPNDVWLGSRKVAGILGEYLVSGETILTYDLGVGVNVANRAPEGLGVSLSELPAFSGGRRAVLQAFLDRFESPEPGTAAEWNALAGDERRHALSVPGGNRLGRAVGVDERFRLLVERPDGSLMACEPGDASLEHRESRT
ncbi:MAG: biotin--[acetyl-CoA-carboxylase] ligase [Spirochaetes bacterium]|nr:biotin--[acetyl-CoA-carboxylase] ligase [Spirochaetota bacterium]